MFLNFALDGYEVWQLQGADPARRTCCRSAGRPPARATSPSSGRTGWPRTRSCGRPPTTHRRRTGCTTRPPAGLELTDEGVSGDSIVLTRGTADPAVLAKFPHLSELPALKIGADDLDAVAELLRGQVAVAATSAAGTRIDATGLQIPGVLDDLYANDADLGVTWDGDVPTLRLWAPTAKSVALQLFADSDPTTHGDHGGDDARPGDRRVVGHRRRIVAQPLLPVRRRGVRAVGGRGGAQRRHRPVLAVAVDELGALADRRPRRPRARPRRVGRRGEARARRAGGPVDLRAARPRLLDLRRDRAGRAARHVRRLHRRRQRRHGAPRRARRCRARRRAPAAGVRLRHRRGGRRGPPGAGPGRARSGRARLGGAATARRGDPRRGRLQLGLRPVALHRARGQLLDRSRRPDAHRRVPRHGRGTQRDRAAGDHGRRLQPHDGGRSGREVRARPCRARLLPPAQPRRRHRDLDVLRQHGQ